MALTTVPASLSATALTLTTAAQPNITSVGTLTGLTVSGNIAGTLTTAAQTNITSVGTLSSLTVSGALNGTLSTAAQPNITSVGTLTGLDIGSNSHTGANPVFGVTVDGANDYIAQFANTDATAGENYGVRILAGSNANDIAFQIKNKDNNTHFMHITGAGLIGMGTNTPATDIAKFGGSAVGLSVAGGQPAVVVRATGNAQHVGYLGQSSDDTYLGAVGGGDLFLQTGTSGTTKVTVQAGGNVGIGTANPSSSAGWGTLLEVSGTTNAGIKLTETDTSNGDYSLGTTAGTFRIWDETASAFRLTLDGSGNVGIGETSPQGNLHVKSADSGATADGGANELVVEGSGNTGISILSGASSSGAVYFGDSGSAYDGYISYDQTNHKFNFATNSSPKMYIDTSGNVGIGASNPSQKLHVVGKIKSTDDLIIGGANPRIDYDGGSSGALRFFSVSANLERMRITSAGNVGIGETSFSNYLAPDLVVVASAQNGGITVKSSSTSHAGSLAFADATSGTDTYDGYVQYEHNNRALTFGTAANERVRINSGGNVGIGTSSPDMGSGWNKVLHLHSASAGSHLRFTDSNTGATGDSGLFVGQYHNGSYFINRENGAMLFYTNNTERVRILAGGNVGIGTNSPSKLLHITGNDNQVVIDGNGSSANSGLFFAEQGTDKWEVYHRGADDTFRVYNYATSSPNLQISAGGAVTHEKQPFSQGRGDAGWTSQTAAATWTKHPLTTPSMRSNRGSNYNTTNKRFTAPVAGVYLIQVSWYAYYPGGGDTGGSQYMHPVIYVNGAANWNNSYTPYTIYGHDIFDTTSHYIAPTLSQSIYLSANDYAEIWVYSRDSDLDFYEYYTYFAFQLIG